MLVTYFVIINIHQLLAQDYYEERIDIKFSDIMSPINDFAQEIYTMLDIIDESDGRARRLFPSNRVSTDLSFSLKTHLSLEYYF